MGGRPARGLLEQTRVALQEEDMEEKVEVQRAKVEKGGQEAPVLKRPRVRTEICRERDSPLTWFLTKTARKL